MLHVTFISDTHNNLHQVQIPEKTDILCHCGDLTVRGTFKEMMSELVKLEDIDVKHKIFIAGNHDFVAQGIRQHVPGPQDFKEFVADAFPDLIYLEKDEVVVEDLRIWGSPWTPWFHDWAFNFPKSDLDDGNDYALAHWQQIPQGIDIVLTHGPAAGIMDRSDHPQPHNGNYHAGCSALLKVIQDRKPLIAASGHIHEHHGVAMDDHTIYVNCSLPRNQHHKLMDPPITIGIYNARSRD